jgi:hypothetical protein
VSTKVLKFLFWVILVGGGGALARQPHLGAHLVK